MADKWVKRWDVPSDSNPDKVYTVAVDGDGQWGCSCPAWTKSKQMRKDCKHIRRVKAEYTTPAGAPGVPPVSAKPKQVTRSQTTRTPAAPAIIAPATPPKRRPTTRASVLELD